LQLQRAIYELKQSSVLWYKNLFSELSNLRLKSISEMNCLFHNEFMILFFFVNDIDLIYHCQYTKQVNKFTKKLLVTYEIHSLDELQWFLEVHVIRNRIKKQLTLNEALYIEKLMIKFHIDLTNRASESSLPHEELIKNQNQATPQRIFEYQQKVESINFAAVITRSNMTHAAFKLSEFLTNSSDFHVACANRVIKYLRHTKQLSIVHNFLIDDLRIIFLSSSDAFYADDVKTRHSIQRYAFMLFNELVD
jgi:hypothetical protein